MKQKRLSLVAHRKSSPNHPLHRRHYLAPAFCTMEDDRASKFEGKRELGLEHLSHDWRNVAHLQAVKSDFADAGLGVGHKLLAKLCKKRDYRYVQRLPGMHSEEISPDEQFSHRRVAAGNVAVGVCHLCAENAEFVGARNGARRIRAVELRHYALQVRLDGFRTDTERSGYRLTLVALSD